MAAENYPKIQSIFSSHEVKHGLALFTSKELQFIENLIQGNKDNYSITCQIKDKPRVAKSEEIIRQLFIKRLLSEFHYPKKRIDVERTIYFGSRDSGFADIVVMHDDLEHPYIIYEVKRPKRSDGLEQLKSYCNADGAPIGVWSNGNEIILLSREEPNIFTSIPRIPQVSETLRDILTERWTIKWLEENDELKKGNTTLKKILLDLEELVLGNAGVDPFEEIFKLIYAKLFDEWKGSNDENYYLDFFVGGKSPRQVKTSIEKLLEGAKRQWRGVFEPTDKIELRDEHLKVCVSFLEKIKLFNSNLQIIDEAFEYLVPQVAKKKEGQFFTPRPVIDMVVKMLNPKFDETIIDPACGSCGFTLHAILWIAKGKLSASGLPDNAKEFAQNRVYGIDFAKKAVKIGKAINLIAGDGKAHVYKANSIAPKTWFDDTKGGLRERLFQFEDQEKDRENNENFTFFDFDILLTNPPFAGTVKEREILRLYELAEKKGKLVKKIGRHILFIERSLHFLRPGGRMAIVLPQGIFNNANTEYIRRFVIENARLLAIVGLHINTFKPYTGTKTSVLLLQKYSDDELEKIEQIKTKYENNFQNYLDTIKKTFTAISWDSKIEDDDIPQEISNFFNSYFSQIEDNEAEAEQDNENESTFAVLIEELKQVQEKRKELGESTDEKKKTKQYKKEFCELEKKSKKLTKSISECTLAGQIWLLLNENKVLNEFKNYWLNLNLVNEMDYPIFMAVNKNSVKDNRGEYRYKLDNEDNILFDEYGHAMIDHDFDEIAEKFIQFAKKEDLEFWA